jgi:hypothetical protein
MDSTGHSREKKLRTDFGQLIFYFIQPLSKLAAIAAKRHCNYKKYCKHGILKAVDLKLPLLP